MLSPQQQKKLERLAKVLDNGDIALLAELDTLEGRVEAVEGIVPALREAVDGDKGEKGERGEKGDSIKGDKGDRGTDGRDGKDGVDGKDGRDGVDGLNGVDGKDGVDGFVDLATVAYLEDEIRRVEKAIPEIVKQKETNFGFVIRDVVAGTGVTIDKSDPNRPIVNASDSSANWTYYATTWTIEPTLNSSITGGDVYNYTLSGTTRYRFVPTTYDATQDAFYTTFSAGVLSVLIVTRG